MRKVLIVHQDERNVLLLKEFLDETGQAVVTGKYHSSAAALSHIANNGCDILITAPEYIPDYIAALESLPLLVCIGNDRTLFSAAAHQNIFAYLYPPFSHERVLTLMQNIDAYFLQRSGAARKDYVFLKSEYKLIKVNLCDILFLSGMRDYTQVYLRTRATPLITLQNLKDFEAKLPDDVFIRVHRSYIISIDHVDAISRNEISINAHRIPIGNAYRPLLESMIEKNS